jgi:carboxymethylenebutenolidase
VPSPEAVKPADVKVPLQGHFANKDDFFTPQAVSAFEEGLKKARKPCEFFRYDADHAFANEQRASVHDRQAAELAWGRAIDFLKKHLG